MPLNGLHLIIIIILLAITFSLFYKKIENYFVFFPQSNLDYSPGDFNLKWQDIHIGTPDGEKLHGWLFHADPDAPFILFCHGNAGNISHRLDNIRLLMEMRLNVLIFDYRGYGKSTGNPSEKGIYLDTLSAYDYLADKEKVKPEKIVVFGRSLGAAAAIDVAAKRKVKSVIIESAFLSTRHMARKMGIFSLLSPFLPAHYNNIEKIAMVTIPKLIIHGKKDEIVPVSMGEKLFEAAVKPKFFYWIEGAEHNDTFVVGGREYLNTFKNFVRDSKINTD
ncbi:alpha/beta hydrolase [Thermodesulfobacteriota bacterium]